MAHPLVMSHSTSKSLEVQSIYLLVNWILLLQLTNCYNLCMIHRQITDRQLKDFFSILVIFVTRVFSYIVIHLCLPMHFTMQTRQEIMMTASLPVQMLLSCPNPWPSTWQSLCHPKVSEVDIHLMMRHHKTKSSFEPPLHVNAYIYLYISHSNTTQGIIE